MPASSQILRPMTADINAQWTESPAGDGWDRLDDVVIQPAAPADVSSDYINTSGINRVQSSALQNVALATGETVTGYTVWLYGYSTGDGEVKTLFAGQPEGVVIAGGATVGWHSYHEDVALADSSINLSPFTIYTGATNSGTCRVYAGYVEVHTLLPDAGVGTLPLMHVGV